jgi:hypothetical protein
MDLRISTKPYLAQTTTSSLYYGQLTSQRMEDQNSHTKPQANLNIIKMEDLYDNLWLQS